MTAIFIICMFAIFIIFDIIVLVKNKTTITTVMRKWYKIMPLVPFTVAVLFIGHFGLAGFYPMLIIPKALGIGIFIALSLAYSVWCIVNRVRWLKGKQPSKFYLASCRVFLIPMAMGSLTGWFWQ